MTSTSTKVNETSDIVAIIIGNNMNLVMQNIDPTFTATIVLSGFPLSIVPSDTFSWTTNSLVNVVKSNDGTNSTLTFSGKATLVLEVIQSLNITLKDHSDQDFTVTVAGTLSDTNGVNTVTSIVNPLYHRVVVRAMADQPTITVPDATYLSAYPMVAGQTTFSHYPIDVALNDLDGSETIEEVVVYFSTGGNLPVVSFITTGGGSAEETAADSGVWTITGTEEEIEYTLQSLNMKPGESNVTDVLVTVTATVVESNPSDPNSNYDDKFALERVDATNTFTVTVTTGQLNTRW